MLEGVGLPRMALVKQSIDTPAALADVREGVVEALRQVELPSGSVAIEVGCRGVGGTGPVVTPGRLFEGGVR